MWRDIAHTSTEAVQTALMALEQRLAHIRENLKTPELRDEFEKANRFRRKCWADSIFFWLLSRFLSPDRARKSLRFWRPLGIR